MELAQEEGPHHPYLQFPDIQSEFSAGYLVSDLLEVGLMSSNGMGPVSVSWQEIEAWARTTSVQPSTWELLTIKALSEEYVSTLMKAADRDFPRPYTPSVAEEDPEEIQIRRDATENKLMSMLGGLKVRKDN